jgi:RNA polymerase sigma factor (sigma-70 family)
MNPDSDHPDSSRSSSQDGFLGSSPSSSDAHSSPPFPANHQALLDRLFLEASQFSWSVSRSDFESAVHRSIAKHFGSAVIAPEKLDEYLSALHLRDLTLAVACAAGDVPAWEYFVASYRPYLRAAAAAILRCSMASRTARDLADSLFADLYGLSDAQPTRRSLFRYFHGRSSLKTWLRAVLAQRHVDALRVDRRFTDLDDSPHDQPDSDRRERVFTTNSAASSHPQSPQDPHRPHYLALFTRTLKVALGLLDPVDRQRLHLYYAQEQTLSSIGRQLGEHESSVSRNLDRIRRQLRSDVETALRNGRVAAHGAASEPGLSDEQISLCFQYASEDSPIDLDTLLPPPTPSSDRLDT